MKKIFGLNLALATVFVFVLTNGSAQTATLAISTNAQKDSVQPYHYPRIAPRNKDFKCTVSGKEIFVYQTSAAPFAAFSCNGSIAIEIELPYSPKNVSVSPQKLGIAAAVNGNKISFRIPGPQLLVLNIDDMPQLFIYANPLETNQPSTKDSLVKYFKAGQVYEVGELQLKSNETLYIEGGAIVRGNIRSLKAENVQIKGFGILDGGYYSKEFGNKRSISLQHCTNCNIEDIILIEPSTWMIVLQASNKITIRNVKELGLVSGSDGVDIVGSKKIKIENCLFRNGDDCVVIKSFDMKKFDATLDDYSKDVEDIEVRGCSFLAYSGGQAMEIGHELRTASVKNIRFIDCDVLGVHGFGGVFGIHNSDRATISNVLYENIRVEHHYDKLIDIRIIKSRYFADEERGQVNNVMFRNIDVVISQYNSGYSLSAIGGYDAKHTVKNVSFENFKLNGVKVTNADQLDLFTKQAFGISFK